MERRLIVRTAKADGRADEEVNRPTAASTSISSCPGTRRKLMRTRRVLRRTMVRELHARDT
jgi:hypothetical protein